MARYRPRSAGFGAALGAGLLRVPAGGRPARPHEDPQACIRSAVRRRRRALGLTQAQAARLTGLSRLAYNRIETGARRIGLAELAALCAAYHCHIGELVQDGVLAQAFADAAKAILGQPPH